MGVTLGTGAALPGVQLSPTEEILARAIDDLASRLKALEAAEQTAEGDEEDN
jgi:hypothetical protein